MMTRVFKNTPVPIMWAIFTALAAHGPTPRVSSPRTAWTPDPWIMVV